MDTDDRVLVWMTALGILALIAVITIFVGGNLAVTQEHHRTKRAIVEACADAGDAGDVKVCVETLG